MTRISDAVLLKPIVGQYQQSFTIRVETPGGMYAGLLDEIFEREFACDGTKLAQYAVGFVEQE